MKIITQLIRLVKIGKWYLSTDRKILKDYLKQIENLEALSESEWSKFREVAKIRKDVYSYS